MPFIRRSSYSHAANAIPDSLRARFCIGDIPAPEEISMLTVVRGLVLGTLIALFMAAAPSPILAQDRDYDEQVFYEELAPYGEWSDHPRWGHVWRPRVSSCG